VNKKTSYFLLLPLFLLAVVSIFIGPLTQPTDAATAEKLFYSIGTGDLSIHRIDTDNTNDTMLFDPEYTTSFMAVDSIRAKLYWWDNYNDKIWISDLDGSNQVEWMACSSEPWGLTAYNGKVYYCPVEAGNPMKWRSEDGLSSGTIVTYADANDWNTYIAIDEATDYMYYDFKDDSAGFTYIYRTTVADPKGPYDGATQIITINHDIWSLAAYDSKVYIGYGNELESGREWELWRANYDGTSQTLVYDPSGSGSCTTIAFSQAESKMYWYQSDENNVYRINLDASLPVTNPPVFMATSVSAIEIYSPPPAPEMSVFGNGIEIVDGDASPSSTDHTDFGHININSGSITRTFTIYNTGGADLTLTDAGNNYVVVIGDGFSLTTPPALTTIPSGGNTTFQVTFDPSASGVSNGTISIANDDTDENPYNFSITGLGTATPTISNLNGDTVTYVENSSPVKLDAGGNAAANDNDGLGWDGGYVDATVSGTFPNSVIGIDGTIVQAGGDGVIAAGETITVSGTDIGTADGTSYGQDGSLIIHLNSNATNALVTTLLQNITYRNTSEDPSGYGDVIFYVQDTYETSSASTVRVNLTGVNDPPTLTATGTNPTFTEGGGSVDLYSGVSISTIESGQTILQIVFTITNINDGSYEIMNIDGTDVTLTDGFSTTTATNSMTVNVSVTGTTATVTVAKIGGISTAAMQTLIDTMTYMNTSENPNTSNRVVTLTSIQDNGGTDNGGVNTTALSVVSTVTVVAVNDRPVVSNLNGDTVSVIAAGAAVLIDLGSNVTVTDVDSTDFNGGWLNISQASGTANGNFSFDGTNVTSGGDGVITAGETVAVGGIDIGTIHAVNDGQGGNNLIIDFNANATPARIATLIRNLMYNAPSGVGARSFDLTVDDGDGGTSTSLVAAFTINVLANPPVITNLDGDTSIYDPFAGGEVIFDVGTDAAVTDPDNTNFNGGNVTVTVSAGGTPAEDVLGISTTGTITLGAGLTVGSHVSVGGVDIGTITAVSGSELVITFNSDATLARVALLLRALTYENTNNVTPSLTGRTIQVVISDAAAPNNGDSAPAEVNINMGQPEINLQQNGTSIASGGTYDFGNHSPGSDTDVTFTIQNTGPVDLTLNGLPLVLGGPDTGEFSIQLQPVSPVAGSGTTTFIIRFTPTTAGLKTVTISIANSDSDEDPYNLTLTGTGMNPPVAGPITDLNLIGNTVAILTDSNGIVLVNYVITSSNGKLTITIPMGTVALDENGNPITTITIEILDDVPPPPPGLNIILPAFSISPSPCSFTPPITITLHYNDGDIPPGVDETSLKIGYYNEATGEWEVLEGIVNPLTNTITITRGSFSVYSLAYTTTTDSPNNNPPADQNDNDYQAPANPTTPAPTVPPTVPSAPLTTSTAPGPAINWWLIAVITAAGVTIISLILWRVTKKSRY